MTESEKYLFDEFKRLDAICRDMFSCQYGISEYITQMEQVPSCLHRQIPGWDRDYHRLKRLRWLRNQIAHETSSTGCGVDDIEQLEDFYNRVLSQQDPLAMLRTMGLDSQEPSPHRHSIVPKDDSSPKNGDRLYPLPKIDNYFFIFSAIALIATLAVCFIYCLE